MQRNVYGVLSFLVLAMFLAAPTVYAQSRLVTNVPFAFSLGDQSMPAGDYEVGSRGEQLALLRNVDTNVAHFLITAQHVDSQYIRGPMLVFNRYGNQYFLSQIWDGSGHTGIQLIKSHREKEVGLAQNGAAGPAIVIIAMK
jgi:hypothetical protein